MVVDAEYSGAQGRALGNQASGLRREVAGAIVAEGPGSLEAVKVDGAHPAGNAVQLGVVPGDRKRDGSVQQRAEIVSVVSVLPKVIQVDQQESANGLL